MWRYELFLPSGENSVIICMEAAFWAVAPMIIAI